MISNYKPKLSIESTDKYEKARNDVLKAKQSVAELTTQQKKTLLEEIFGVEAATKVFKIMQEHFR